MSVIVIAILTALALTILCASEEERIEIAEMVDNLSDQEDPVRQIDWDNLPAEIVAWVEVLGTNIDEPIVQATPDAPNAYLYRDVFGQGAYGTPYIDCECSIDSRFVMVYGHHMSDGAAFADFASFSNHEYAAQHLAIYVYTRDGERHEHEAKAVDIINADIESVRTGFESDADRVAYLKEAIEGSDMVIEEAILGSERVWGFTTCSYQRLNSRVTVYAAESACYENGDSSRHPSVDEQPFS